FGRTEEDYLDLEVDMDRDCVIVRMNSYSQDVLVHEHDVRAAMTEHGWMPQSWRSTMLFPDGRIHMATENQIIERDLGLDTSDVVFHMDPAADMYHWSEEAKETYKRLSDGRDVLASAPEAREDGRFRWTLIVIINSLVAAMILFVWLRARAARGHA
ncbi:MAG: hypothetical protein KF861_12690, partial [Planctomycetaceae bacterium]|nr:hypothetical protein [Planctomycetaceae bacterium]